MEIKKRTARVLAVVVLGVSLGIAPTLPANAHGTGVVKSCQRGTDCTTDSSKNAVFAICSPVSAASTCDPGRDVTIQLRNFGSSQTVHVWWLNGEVTDPTRTDCRQAVGLGRTHLGDVTTNGSGAGSLDAHLPPPGGTPGTWSYGENWLCATTAPHDGGSGVIGDQLFMIYPA